MKQSIDIRTCPSLAAFRMHALVKSLLSPQLKQSEDLTMKCWIPLTKKGDAAAAKKGLAGRLRYI